MLAVHSILEELVLRVDVVENGIGVGLVRGREDYNLKHLVGLLETLHEVGSQINARAYSFLARKVDFKDNIWILRLDVVDTVH